MIHDLISFIVPCYNQCQFLDDCLESIYFQTYLNWECLIINDGSTDETELAAKKWIDKDSRFRYFEKVNGGLSSARNLGLNYAKGNFIHFLDSDDTIHPKKLELQLNSFNDSIDIVICDYLPFDSNFGTFISSQYNSPFPSKIYPINEIILNWEVGLSIPCHCIIFRAEILKKPNSLLFNESLFNHEDWVFWVILFHRSSRLEFIRLALANYRKHDKSMCVLDANFQKGFLQAIDELQVYFNSINVKKYTFYLRLKKIELKYSGFRKNRLRVQKILSFFMIK